MKIVKPKQKGYLEKEISCQCQLVFNWTPLRILEPNLFCTKTAKRVGQSSLPKKWQCVRFMCTGDVSLWNLTAGFTFLQTLAAKSGKLSFHVSAVFLACNRAESPSLASQTSKRAGKPLQTFDPLANKSRRLKVHVQGPKIQLLNDGYGVIICLRPNAGLVCRNHFPSTNPWGRFELFRFTSTTEYENVKIKVALFF